jgi:hypothetical protein
VYQIPEIEDHCGANPAGLLAVYAVRTQAVLSIPRAVAGIISDDIVLRANITWSRIGFASESAGFEEKATLSGSGELFKQTVMLQVPKDSPEMVDYLNSVRQGTFALLIEEPDGGYRLVGHLDTPARLIADTLIDAKGSGRNAHPFQFEAVSRERCPFYTGSIAGLSMLMFSINSIGELLYENSTVPTTSCTINGSGELVITGPDEARYSLDTLTGEAVFT